ncbi:DUF4173 domain-containing protein [Afipia sp. GAS231]|uniref:DUF4153 domain-containing protein n=1 Tax=Afipia sp. GAS231 TaxID=1882747 RepID=UPI00087BB856|nr:DUF4173 domain-containing protein [Afipia sp. GAS231]SDN51106.1 protein of unknown function [Afipia sp. GAS231]
MTDFPTPASDSTIARKGVFPVKPAIAIALAALADWLFCDQPVGISAVIFTIALILGSLLANFATMDRTQLSLASLLAAAGLVPAFEEFNAISLAFIILSLGICLQLTTNRQRGRLGQRARALGELYLIAPFRMLRDVPGTISLPTVISGIAVWFIPIVLGGVFIFLFASANPVIEKWINLIITPANAASHINIGRTLFWFAVLSIVWPFVHVRWRNKSRVVVDFAEAVTQEQDTRPHGTDFFSAATILRSLILFNLLFAVQTVLDAIYLWGNTTLPADISYASYAHRGAYPLIVTALLAAGFVLAAMKPGDPAGQSKIMRPLVYLWVAQNVLLVVSSILRLDLYVQIYLLTWWRIAAFIWMGLVVIGLLLIVARIVLNRSNGWLIRANLMVLTTTLYLCALVDLTPAIADYNISHSREVSGKGVWLDTIYLRQLGPQALPAIDRAFVLRGRDPYLAAVRDRLVEQQQKDMASWRAWGFRSWRLQRTLDARQNSTTG